VSALVPGCDEVVLTAPDDGRLCNSRGCADTGRLAEVIVTYRVLNDPGASLYARGALGRESWHKPVPMCGACWESSQQVAVKSRPGLVVIDMTTPAGAAQSSGGRA
jgi:hypothetical protein